MWPSCRVCVIGERRVDVARDRLRVVRDALVDPVGLVGVRRSSRAGAGTRARTTPSYRNGRASRCADPADGSFGGFAPVRWSQSNAVDRHDEPVRQVVVEDGRTPRCTAGFALSVS